jgi:DNA-binding CsgD family transcriptional regulator
MPESDRLSGRETEVVDLLVQGRSNKQIAALAPVYILHW